MNLHSRKLPGGSLLHAIYNRQIMMWSDRGGASHFIGEQWAKRCTDFVEYATGNEWPIPGGGSHTLIHVLRLDSLNEVSKEANKHQLENPDFLLIGVKNRNGSRPVVQAADAKFAVDRIKRSQVSADAVRNLITVPDDGITRGLLDDAIEQLEIGQPEIVRGLFICPRSTLTDYLLTRRNRGRPPKQLPEDLLDISTNPEQLFSGLPMTPLIGTLARIDKLEVSPRDNLLSALYYFRAACACFYFWREDRQPLLAEEPEDLSPEAALVAAEISFRSSTAATVADLMFNWSETSMQISADRKAVNAAAKLPIGIREVKQFAADAGHGGDKQFARQLRSSLEQEFRRRLLDVTGVIHADDPRPLDQILRTVSQTSRNLRPDMLACAREMAFEDQLR